MNSMEISVFLENIRYGRKISQDDFCSGIVSLRQYQRYRNGECEITYEKLEQFANKLGIPTKKMMYEFERSRSIQYKMITMFYNAVVNRDAALAKEYKAKVEKENIFDEDRQLYFNHALMMNDYYRGIITKADMLDSTSKLINYPTIIKQKFLTDIEVLILSFLLTLSEGYEQMRLLNKLTELFENEDWIMSGESNFAYSLILMRMSQVYGIQKNFSQVIKYCDLGIKRGIYCKQYYLMEYFYYYRALANFRLECYDIYEESLFRCYGVLHLEGNKKKIEKFTNLIEKDFHINFDAFIINYLKKGIL
ncbi:MAG: helix-turn-helix transcriptional regulator [Candidatus Izemoplasmatales bacterium]